MAILSSAPVGFSSGKAPKKGLFHPKEKKNKYAGKDEKLNG